uniref:Solute carrier family 12 member 8 n=1 Tax=Petromyzon marinus TaxID=7757 RepID=A0AAJ7WLM0_PETMA|nr:solute carrier family 12 member 8 isoform X3 [Petromyzon marinus]
MSGEDQGDRTALLAAATAKAMAADDADEKAEATDNYGSTKENGKVQDLFHEETQAWAWGAWWKAKLLARKPSLFGTWTGVFTSCLVNILGVVLFLRTGYVVGNAGVLLGVLMVFLVILVALVSVLSGIGVCERCKIGSGGIYFMISTVLGGKVGGTIGLLYVFGQCVVGALYVTGFAESVADTFGLSNIWAVRGIAIGVVLGLLGINLAGVKWVIRLQLVLLALLAVSMLDFVIGSFTHLDPENGFVGYTEELLKNNTFPDYTPGESFFTVFGVFFPTATGVMAGFNMSGDLKTPSKNIPVGSLAAIGITWFLYLVFVLLLGATCTREALRVDFMIAEKVSLVGFLFLVGLYISSLASCMTGLYGAPRILQCIAQERVIPIIEVLGRGHGPNKTPVYAIGVVGVITTAFIFVGQVNILAPIVTINFLLTYATIDYSYFALAMTYDEQQERRLRLASGGVKMQPKPQVAGGIRSGQPNASGYQPLIDSNGDGNGANRAAGQGSLQEFTKDMDLLFPKESSGSSKVDANSGQQQAPRRGRSRKPAKETLQDSFMLDLEGQVFKTNDPEKRKYVDPMNDVSAESDEQTIHQDPLQDLASSSDSSQQETQSKPKWQLKRGSSESDSKKDIAESRNPWEAEISQMSNKFYAKLCNRWVSLLGMLVCLVVMMVIQWIYALVNLVVALLLLIYIGQSSPGLPPGIATDFNFFTWIKSLFLRMCRRGPAPKEQFVVTPSLLPMGLSTTQLTQENADFASRDRFHQSSVVQPAEFNHKQD